MAKKKKENPEKKENVKIVIELNDKQQKMYEKWTGHLKALYGEIGGLAWTWSAAGGIGEEIKVYSSKARVELDLTDIDSW